MDTWISDKLQIGMYFIIRIWANYVTAHIYAHKGTLYGLGILNAK